MLKRVSSAPAFCLSFHCQGLDDRYYLPKAPPCDQKTPNSLARLLIGFTGSLASGEEFEPCLVAEGHVTRFDPFYQYSPNVCKPVR